MLVRHLPHDSEVNRALHGEAAEWSVGDYLLAAAVDHLAAANWMTATLNRDEDDEPPEYPEPVPRPGAGDGAADGDDEGPDGPEGPGDGSAGAAADGASGGPVRASAGPGAPAAGQQPETGGDDAEPPRAPVRGPSAAELARFFG